MYVKGVKKLEVDLNFNDFEIINSTKLGVEFKAGEGWGGGSREKVNLTWNIIFLCNLCPIFMILK